MNQAVNENESKIRAEIEAMLPMNIPEEFITGIVPKDLPRSGLIALGLLGYLIVNQCENKEMWNWTMAQIFIRLDIKPSLENLRNLSKTRNNDK